MSIYPRSTYHSSIAALLFAAVVSFSKPACADEPEPKKPAGARPYATLDITADPSATSVLELYPGAAGAPPVAVLRKTQEPPYPADRTRLPILAREICRQALLVAARDGLRWTTRDEAIGEVFEEEPDAKRQHFTLVMHFPVEGPAEFTLRRLAEGDDAKKAPVLWSEQLRLQDGPESLIDYRLLIAAADKWSREAFPTILRSDDLPGSANKTTQATVPDDARERLENMTDSEQFAALRRLHRSVRDDGESPELLGALIRGYANLGLLTEFHWTAAHKAFKARALVYAARLTGGDKPSPWALWHRAYAEALTGLHKAALEDLTEAAKLAEQSSGDKIVRPAWVPLIDAFCRFQTEKLTEATADNHLGQLAALLRFLHVESVTTPAQTVSTARESLEVAPQCFRICDSVCGIPAIATLHWATDYSLSQFFESFPNQVRSMPEPPANVVTLLKPRGDDAANAVEVAEALIDSAETNSGRDEMSWAVLGRLTRETAFAQLWRRIHFMRFQWSVPIDDLLPAVVELLEHHRYVAFLECYGLAGDELKDAANRFADALDVSELDYAQQDAINAAIMQTWMEVRLNQHLAAFSASAAHADDTYRDLTLAVEQVEDKARGARRLWTVSPHGAAGVAALVQYDLKTAGSHLNEWEKEHAAHATVLAALANHYLTLQRQDDAQRCLQAYVAVSPDAWAYLALANQYKQQNKIDDWLKTLDGYLEQEEFGLEHAQTRVQIANFFMERKEWDKAQPYAEAAAESWAEWAMLCAVRCYQGMLDEEQEGIWLGRLLERYPSRSHALTYLFWCHRTGMGDTDVALEIMEPYLGKGQGAGAPSNDAFVLMVSGRRRDALEAFQALERKPGVDASNRCFAAMQVAQLAHELGDRELADKELQAVAAEKDPTVSAFTRLAAMFAKHRAAEKETAFDVAQARKVMDACTGYARLNVACFIARYLESAGQTEDAKDFYRQAATVPGALTTGNHALAREALRRLGAELDGEALKTDVDKQ